jgi:hypothetical protein
MCNITQGYNKKTRITQRVTQKNLPQINAVGYRVMLINTLSSIQAFIEVK